MARIFADDFSQQKVACGRGKKGGSVLRSVFCLLHEARARPALQGVHLGKPILDDATWVEGKTVNAEKSGALRRRYLTETRHPGQERVNTQTLASHFACSHQEPHVHQPADGMLGHLAHLFDTPSKHLPTSKLFFGSPCHFTHPVAQKWQVYHVDQAEGVFQVQHSSAQDAL